jgi:hypothetical protein
VFAPVSEEPDQTKVLAPPAGFANKSNVPPLQIGLLLVGDAIGLLFTVTCVVYTLEGAQPASVVPSLTMSE